MIINAMTYSKTALAILGLLWSVSAQAQQPSPEPTVSAAPDVYGEFAEVSPDIVVKGEKSEIRSELRTLFADSQKQLVRHEVPFCLTIMGFDPEYAQILKRLIHENAGEAGLPVAERPCETNALMVFIDEPHELAKQMRKKYPGTFRGMSIYSRNRLLEPDRPYYAWQLDRYFLPGGGAKEPGISSADGALVAGGDAPTFRSFAPSRIKEPVTIGTRTAFLLVDIDRIEGMGLGQLADFASLQLMMKLRRNAEENARVDSMLRLFDVAAPGDLPARMNSFDKAMLNGLYAMKSNNILGAWQRGRIATHMKQQTANEAPDETPEETGSPSDD